MIQNKLIGDSKIKKKQDRIKIEFLELHTLHEGAFKHHIQPIAPKIKRILMSLLIKKRFESLNP
jgi:hypothetical protein